MGTDSQLVIDGYRQSVTTIVTAEDEDGKTYVLLGRPDPRYRDGEGKCLKGEQLKVGPYQFIGGQVDDLTFQALLQKFVDQASGEVTNLDQRVDATALKELIQEASFNPDHIAEDGTLDYVGDIKREGRHGQQQIHYLRLNLGTFSVQDIGKVLDSFAPKDDMLVTTVIDIDKIKKDDRDHLVITPADGITKIKKDFSGFNELDTWDRNFEAAIAQAEDDKEKQDTLRAQQNNYHNIDKIRGMGGIDKSCLDPNTPVGMYTPGDVKIVADGVMLGIALANTTLDIGEPKEPPITTSRNFLFLTNDPGKIRDYRRQFGLYGIGVDTMPWQADQNALEAKIKARLLDPTKDKESQKGKPKFVLNEWSDLYNAETHEVSTRNTDMEPVYNQSNLIVYYIDKDGQFQKEEYYERIDGYIDLDRRETRKTGTFNWNDVFVNSATGLSYNEAEERWGACSARHLVMADFIQRHVFYSKRKKLHREEEQGDDDVPNPTQTPEQTVDFGYSIAEEIASDSLINANQHLGDWFLDNFFGHMLNDGVHARAASNRRENHYHAPALNAGVANVPIEDPMWQIGYRVHDFLHYYLAKATDYVPIGNFNPENNLVYHVGRMMSEAMTIVMSDMLFIDGLKRSGIEYDYTQRKIHPLFAALDIPGETQQQRLTHLLWASVNYTLLGDDSYFRAMLKPGEEAAAALAAFEDHYSRYFVGDHRWTDANFNNMAKQAHVFSEWHHLVGDETFARAHLSLLDDVTARIESTGTDMSSYTEVVRAVFDDVMQHHILPHTLTAPDSLTTEQRTSNAFRRWMVGQAACYAKYIQLDGMRDRANAMMAKIQHTDHFSADDIARLRKELNKDVFRVHGARVIGHASRRIYQQTYPIFPPFYLAGYAKEGGDIKGRVAQIFGPQPDGPTPLPFILAPSTNVSLGKTHIEDGPERGAEHGRP